MPHPKISAAISKLRLKVKHIEQVPESHSSLVRILALEDGNKVVLKIHWNAQKQERELLALRHLQAHQQFPGIIDWYEEGNERALLMEYLPGVPLRSYQDLTPLMAHQLGQAMALVHRIPLPNFEGYSTWHELLAEKTRKYQRFCEGIIDLPVFKKGADLFLQNLDRIPNSATASLVHFDLRLGNLLADQENIIGIIDFESSRGGSGSMDFYKLWQEVWIHSPELQEATIRGYRTVGSIQVDLESILPLYGLYHAMAGITWCIKRQRHDDEFYRHNLLNLQHYMSIFSSSPKS